ncbi:MAG: ATP synthase F1 subunit gamma [Candidatus Levybacteria bacterium CG10_big_fil_rev_8_21_14_0_10_36_7]|nr:MAG: ATP synthase F1 subunit gamma [Candidatus Levybacteria bacterium CG10_big_fil_rev_8_21_14_0_10_36_7]
MAENLKVLKGRIKTAKNIAQIAKAMEMISASKIKKAQTSVINNKPYKNGIVNLTDNILSHNEAKKYSHPYLFENESDKSLLIILSPDKGLCGSLNTNLNKKILELDNKNTKIVVLGKKASQFCKRGNSEVIAEFPFGTTLPEYSQIYKIAEIINAQFLSKSVSNVKLLYSQFSSIFLQEPLLVDLLPIKSQATEVNIPYIFEPKIESLLSDLLPYYLEVLLYTAMIEAYTSEQAARMVAMQNAKNSALDIADFVTLTYNKSRQERITSELLTLSNNITL